jgi:flagellar protein FlaH
MPSAVATLEPTAVNAAITTGNPEIDKKIGGGIPMGSLTLLEGPSDSGKSVLAQQMVWGSVTSGHRVKVFTTENTSKSLIKQMDSLGLSIIDYYFLGRLGIRPLRLSRQANESINSMHGLLQAVSQEATTLVFIDSLTGLVMHTPVEETIAFFEGCKSFCNEGRTVVCTLHSAACEESTIIRIRSMCDAHLRFTIEAVGEQLVKTLEVAKIRGAQRGTGNILSFDVEPKMGMRIIPVMKAKA